MGIPSDDVVLISQSENQENLHIITVNCPDKTGLGCDLCRIILLFQLSIVKGDVSTDGKWCYLVFWVVGKSTTRWSLLKNRLVDACPTCSSASEIYYYKAESFKKPKPSEVFLLKLCCNDRSGLLHDVTKVLCELELVIKRVKISTTPDGSVMDLFFITDTRELLHTKSRQEEAHSHLKSVLGDIMISCDIELVVKEMATSPQGNTFLPPDLAEEMFSLEMPKESTSGHSDQKYVSVIMDNHLSPAHTLIQIQCEDHKGLLYDITRTLKDYNIQISYGRFNIKQGRKCEVDLFIVQADGKKVIDPNKQTSLCSRLRMELTHPLRVTMVSQGPDTELLVANPVELSGKGRPLVFYDITLALKKLSTCIFRTDAFVVQAKIGRHIIRDREWEVYKIRLDEGNGFSLSTKKIEGEVRNMLMGWEA